LADREIFVEYRFHEFQNVCSGIEIFHIMGTNIEGVHIINQLHDKIPRGTSVDKDLRNLRLSSILIPSSRSRDANLLSKSLSLICTQSINDQALSFRVINR